MTSQTILLLILSLLLATSRAQQDQDILKTNGTKAGCDFDQECVQRHLCENTINHNTNRKLCGFMMVCCKNTEMINKPLRPNQEFEACGYRNSNGDQVSTDSVAPWTVVIMESVDGEWLSQFGGSIIAPTVILTSAHKINKLAAETLIVRAGNLASSEAANYQEKRGQEIILHPQFREGQLLNDIALLILNSTFVWNAQVRPICLPPQDTNFDGANCVATGWGRNEFDLVDTSLSAQMDLNEIEVSVVPSFKCQANLRTTFLGGFFQLHRSFICAGGEEGKDTCKGDGGSPLVCPIVGQRNRFQQAGIVSWGIGCGQANVAGVYVNVAGFRQWIDEKLSYRSVANSHYTAEIDGNI